MAETRWSKYLFETSNRYTIDGANRRNVARYITIPARRTPAAEIDERGRVFIYAVRRIEAGEEICYNYGKSYFDSILKPMGCRCGACDGTAS